MSRITDYILEPKIVYTEGGFLVRVKVQDDYKYKKYLVTENLHYKTVLGTTFTLTDASSTKQASILELKGNTTQEGTPTPSNPIEVKTVSGDNNIVVSNKNLCYLKEGNYSYSTTSTWSIEGDTITTTVNDITYQGGSLNLLTGTTGRWSSSSMADLHLTTNGGTYTITGIKEGIITKGTSGNLYTYIFIYKDNGTYRNDYILYNADTQSKTITLNSDEHIGCVSMYSQYITCENVKIKIQLEKGSTPTTYIAHTGNSYRVDLGGKNLFDKNNANILTNIYIGSSSLGSSNGAKTLYIPCESNTTYTVSKIQSARFIIGTTTTTPAQTVAISNRQGNNSATSLTTTTGANAKYLCVFYYLASADTVTEQSILDSLQIEKRKYGNTI